MILVLMHKWESSQLDFGPVYTQAEMEGQPGEILYAVYQSARIATNPRTNREQAIVRIGSYLMKTTIQGMKIRSKASSMELWCMLILNQETAQIYRDKSITRLIIKYAPNIFHVCPRWRLKPDSLHLVRDNIQQCQR